MGYGRSRGTSDSATFIGVTNKMREVLWALGRNYVFASHPYYSLDEVLDLITKKEDREFLAKALTLTGQIHYTASLNWQQPIAGSKQNVLMRFVAVKGVPEKAMHPIDEAAHPDVCRALDELRQAAVDYAILQATFTHLVEGYTKDGGDYGQKYPCVTTLAQLAKVWPKGFDICFPQFTSDQRRAVDEARKGARLARAELTPEMQRALSFVEFHVARASLLDDGWPDNKAPLVKFNVTPAERFKLYVSKDLHLKLDPKYPY